MGTNQLTNIKRTVGGKDANPAVKKVKSQLVKVTLEEIKATRPSVYKYLLP